MLKHAVAIIKHQSKKFPRHYVKLCFTVVFCITLVQMTGLVTILRQTPFTRDAFDYPADDNLISRFENNEIKLPVYIKMDYRYVLEPDDVCSGNLDAVLLVKSAAEHFEFRSVIRRSWKNDLRHHSMKMFFLTGKPSRVLENSLENEIVHSNLASEAAMYADILQYDHADTYFDNTHKALMGLHWMIQHGCARPQPGSKRSSFNSTPPHYLVMIDDDYFLNASVLQDYLTHIPSDQYENFISGYVFANSMPMRYPMSKWYIDLEEYQWSRWPPYPTAGCYVVSWPLAQRINRVAPHVKYLRFDDVYLGIVLWRLRVTPRHENAFLFKPPFFSSSLRKAISVHMLGSYRDVETTWLSLQQKQQHPK